MKLFILTALLTLLMTGQAYAEEGIAGISVTLDQVKGLDICPQGEKEVLYRIVEAEATGKCIEAKKNVASVILNRVHSKDFPNTITGVVFQKHQFSPIGDKRYWSVEVTEETIQAVDEVVKHGTTTEALYFVNLNNTSQKMKNWFKKLEYLFTDPSGHSFYK
jgi:N-acetylmuramoyl-L-alanine amidase